MNERIRKLAEQAGFDAVSMVSFDIKEDLEKFAELIVQECVDRVTSKANGWGDMTGFAIKESILDCAKDLKEHFGVEE
jgi:hypothetical protein